MSYENPRTAIDTQSAQHLANLQNTLSSNLKVMGDRYRADQLAKNKKLNERAKENALMAKEAQKTEDNITDNLNKTTARLGLDQQVALNTVVSKTSELIDANNSGNLSPEQVAENKRKISAYSVGRVLGLSVGFLLIVQLTQTVQTPCSFSNCRSP